MILRQAREGDFPAMVRLLNESSAAFYRAILPPDQYKDPWYTADTLRRDLEPYQIVVIQDDIDLAGLIAFAPVSPKALYLFLLFIRSDCIGRGLGTTLFAEAVCEARRLKCEHLLLQTHRRAEWATAAYFRWGFRVAAEGDGPIRAFDDGVLGEHEIDPHSLLLICPVENAGAGLPRGKAAELAGAYACMAGSAGETRRVNCAKTDHNGS